MLFLHGLHTEHYEFCLRKGKNNFEKTRFVNFEVCPKQFGHHLQKLAQRMQIYETHIPDKYDRDVLLGFEFLQE